MTMGAYCVDCGQNRLCSPHAERVAGKSRASRHSSLILAERLESVKRKIATSPRQEIPSQGQRIFCAGEDQLLVRALIALINDHDGV